MSDNTQYFFARLGAPFLDRPVYDADIEVKNVQDAVAAALEKKSPCFVLMSMAHERGADGKNYITQGLKEESGTCFVGFDEVYTRDALIEKTGDGDRLRKYPSDTPFVMNDSFGLGAFSPLAIYPLRAGDAVYNAAGEQIWAGLPPGVKVSVELTPAFTASASPPELKDISATLAAHGAELDIVEPARHNSLCGAAWFFAKVRNKQLADSLEGALKKFPGAIKSAGPLR